MTVERAASAISKILMNDIKMYAPVNVCGMSIPEFEFQKKKKKGSDKERAHKLCISL